MPVLLLMSFSAMANVWTSSSLSHNERKLYAVSNDTARNSRASSKGVAYSVEKQSIEMQKDDSIFKTLNLDEVVVTAAMKEYSPRSFGRCQLQQHL